MIFNDKQLATISAIADKLDAFIADAASGDEDDVAEVWEDTIVGIESRFNKSIAPTLLQLDDLLTGEESNFLDRLNEKFIDKVGIVNVKWGPSWLKDEEVFEEAPAPGEHPDIDSVKKLAKEVRQMLNQPKLRATTRKAMEAYRDELRRRADFVDSVMKKG